MGELEAGVLAARLLGIATLVLLAPGLALLRLLRVPAEWPERIVLAFSISYSWMFVLSVATPLFRWTVDYAALATLLLIAGLTVAVRMRNRRDGAPVTSVAQPRFATLLVVAILIAVAVAGWVIEPPFGGEEALDLISLSRFADGGPITLDNASLLPDTPALYLFQPYQLALGIIARWSGTDPLIAFVKFRTVLAPLCLVCIYALLRRFTLSRTEAVAAFLVVVLFVALELETWEINSLFPFVSRGSFSVGVLVPALMVLWMLATRRVPEGGDGRLRRVAMGVAPVMLVASMSTHAVEMTTFLCFAGAGLVVIMIGADRTGDRKRALVVMLALLMMAGSYLAVHSRVVSSGTEPGSGRRAARLTLLFTNPREAIALALPESGSLLVWSSPLTTAVVVGIPALGLAALRTPAAAAVLALATVPLALFYATPPGIIVLEFLTAYYLTYEPAAMMRETTAYFMFMGILGVALGLVALAQGVLRAAVWRPEPFRQLVVGFLALVLVLIAGQAAVRWLGNYASTEPDGFLGVVAAGASTALVLAVIRSRPLLDPAPYRWGVVLLTACLAVPLAIPGLVFGGVFARQHASMFGRFSAALSRPSVLNWPAYYEELAHTIAPPLPVPRTVVDELRRRVPPRQILLAHPSYSCALVVLMDAYCVNPEFIYGAFFLSARRYQDEYVRRIDGQPPEHPFFNSRTSLTADEDRFLTEYHVSYLLADPEHAEPIALKLKEATVGTTLEMDQDGYRLYKVNGS